STTCAPSHASTSVIASPSPFAAPVTSATLSRSGGSTYAPQVRSCSFRDELFKAIESELDHHHALLGHLAHGVVGALPCVAGLLRAAVRHLVDAKRRRLVDGHAPELEALARADRRREIAREDAGL